jgi:hypothetical protein
MEEAVHVGVEPASSKNSGVNVSVARADDRPRPNQRLHGGVEVVSTSDARANSVMQDGNPLEVRTGFTARHKHADVSPVLSASRTPISACTTPSLGGFRGRYRPGSWTSTTDLFYMTAEVIPE